jgi:hypothetical protein
MSRGLEVHCPICKMEVGLGYDCKTPQEVSEALAKHIFAEHTKRQKGGPALLQVPVENAPLTMDEKRDIQIYGHLNPSRDERRRHAKKLRGNGYGRTAR